MRRRNAKSAIVSASDIQVARFKNGADEGPTLTDFLVYLKGPPRSKWNEQAADIFADALIRSGWTRCMDEEAIKKIFFVHLQTLRAQYQKQFYDVRQKQESADTEQQKRRDGRRRGVSSPTLQSWFQPIPDIGTLTL